MIRNLLSLLLLALVCVLARTQTTAEIPDAKITFSSTEMTVRIALEEIIEKTETSLTYNINNEILGQAIQFSAKKLDLNKAFDEIQQQVPVEIMYLKNQVIIKEKDLHQKYRISGYVFDLETNEPLIGSNVFISESLSGTVTDTSGNFSLNLAPGVYTLVCNYMGFKDKQTKVHLYENKTVTFLLEPDQKAIKAVNIFGNRTENQDLEVGRTIETLESKEIDRLDYNNLTDALHARFNGIWTTKVSGAPGDQQKIRIRGISSIFGSTDPLYVVDGMIIPVVNFKSLGVSGINTHDVENITILKDASSTAQYGYLGGNGVILIDTKKGNKGSGINVSVQKGYQTMKKRYPLMSSKLFLNTLEASDSLINTDFYKQNPREYLYQKYPYYEDATGKIMCDDNYQDEIFQLGEISEYQLSGSGKTLGQDFFLSGNYNNHEGILIHSQYKKYTLTGSLSGILKKKINYNLIYRGSYQSNQNNLNNYLGNDIIFKGINYEPSYRTTHDSLLSRLDRFYYNDITNNSVNILSSQSINPEQFFHEQIKEQNITSNNINLSVNYSITPKLSAKAILSYSQRKLSYLSTVTEYSNTPTQKHLESNDNFIIINQQYSIEYKNRFGNHFLSSSLKYRNYTDNIFWGIDSLYNVEIGGINIEDNVYVRGSQALYGDHGSVVRTIQSQIGNINYNYKQKYFVSLLVNYDRINEGNYLNQKDIFPSIALNWDISKENFLIQHGWLNHFNLYANWGQAGNYPLNSLSNDIYTDVSINRFANLDFGWAPQQYLYDSIADVSDQNASISGVAISNLSNHHIKHEKVTEYNVGSEISLLKNYLVISADYFIKYNSNLLVLRDIPYYYGGGFIYQNIGEMKNTGIELSLEVSPVLKPNIEWRTRIAYASNKQQIIKLLDSEQIRFNNTDVLFPDFAAEENEQLGSIIGYKYLGKWEDQEIGVDELPAENEEAEFNKTIEHFGLEYQKTDTLNPEKLTKKDKVNIGKSVPDFTLSWFNEIKYKAFGCEMVWYAVIGTDKYNATKAATYITGIHEDVRDIVVDTMNYLTDNIFYESSYFVEDASFIRLQSIRFTYAPPKKILNKIAVEYALSFENIITLTNYSGYDPESTIFTNNNFSDNAIDRGAYPIPKGINFRISLHF